MKRKLLFPLARAFMLLSLVALVVSACSPAAPAPTPTTPPPPVAAAPTAPPPAPVPTVALATPTPGPFPVTVTDGAGRSVTVAQEPATIVSLAPSNTEILYALGLGDRVVGVTPHCDYPEAAKGKKQVVGMDLRANKEEIVRLAPDLVLAGSISNPDDIKGLEGLNLTVFVLGAPMAGPQNIDEVLADIETVGKVTGKAAEAQKIVGTLRARVEDVAAKIETLDKQGLPKPRVFYELDATEPSKPFTAGPDSFIDSLITLAGGTNIAADAKMQWAQLSSEEIIKKDPEIIVLGDAKYGMTADQVEKRPGWAAITAVQRGQIHPIDDDLISRPGPRVVDGLEALAKMFHPELFR